MFAAKVSHELGVTDVPDSPQSIVVLELSFIDALASVGMAPVGIADDNKRDRVIPAYTDIIGHKWTSVGTRKTPSLEIISSLTPDLIIADKTRHSVAYTALSEIAPTIVLDSLGGDYYDALKQIHVIGKALDKEVKMDARIAQHKATIAAYVDKIKPFSKGVTAQFGVTNSNGLWLHSPLSYNGSLLSMFGFQSSMPPTEGGVYEAQYVPTSLEQLSAINLDILILGKYTTPAFTDGWSEDLLYKGLSSVKSNKVYNVTAHNWSRLRGMLAAELTAEDVLQITAVEKGS